MDGDKAEEVVVPLHSEARSNTPTTSEFDQQLADQYANWLRSHGYMVVKRDRLKVLDVNHVVESMDTMALTTDQKAKLISSLDTRCAHKLMEQAIASGLVHITQSFSEAMGNSVRRYEIAIVAPRVIS
jgi:hypothetical protein